GTKGETYSLELLYRPRRGTDWKSTGRGATFTSDGHPGKYSYSYDVSAFDAKLYRLDVTGEHAWSRTIPAASCAPGRQVPSSPLRRVSPARTLRPRPCRPVRRRRTRLGRGRSRPLVQVLLGDEDRPPDSAAVRGGGDRPPVRSARARPAGVSDRVPPTRVAAAVPGATRARADGVHERNRLGGGARRVVDARRDRGRRLGRFSLRGRPRRRSVRRQRRERMLGRELAHRLRGRRSRRLVAGARAGRPPRGLAGGRRRARMDAERRADP